MENYELEALAYDEAIRILEKYFSYYNPYTNIIEVGNVPYNYQERFCQMVEYELKLKGEDIKRDGRYFKILKYQPK